MHHSITRGAARRILTLTLIAASGAACATAASAGTAAAATGAAATGAAATGDAAAAQSGTPAITVKYADLNLGTEAGVHALYSRLVHAANQVCGVEYSRDLRVMQMTQACRDAAVARAVREVASPRLAVLAAAHSKTG